MCFTRILTCKVPITHVKRAYSHVFHILFLKSFHLCSTCVSHVFHSLISVRDGPNRGPLATFAECTECGGMIHHWCRKYDHISPMLRDRHWLPRRQRIIFKIATLMHQ